MELEKRYSKGIETKTDEGVVTAYLTKWDSIDSYKTTFKRGIFKRAYKRQSWPVKLLWNHGQLAGKVLNITEDGVGPLAKVQFNLNTMTGKDAFEHIKAGDLDCFSFGFTSKNDVTEKGVRTKTDIDLYEVSPVIFEANHNAKIVDVRSQDENYWTKINNVFKNKQ